MRKLFSKSTGIAMVCLLFGSVAWGLSLQTDAPVNPLLAEVRIRYAVMPGFVTVRTTASLTVRSGDTEHHFPAGEWKFEGASIVPARKRHHVFPKTFHPREEQALTEYVTLWRGRGYSPQVETFGVLFETESGRTFDNRRHWVSLARFDAKDEAQALIDRLKQESVWAWQRVEKVAPGSAAFTIYDKRGNATATDLASPLYIACDVPVEVLDVSSSYWKNQKANRLFLSPLQLEPGMDGAIEVFGSLPVEKYLRGVLPAEMPASWPVEALKAQAVVARSEIYASLADKYRLEGFDFTALEGCRAYSGIGGHQSRTDAAVLATAGFALAADGAFILSVFSSSCGGWTENNENVWSGPANPILRGIPDFSSEKRPANKNIHGLLTSSPPAWCSQDPGFRWRKQYTVQELSHIVNNRHRVGAIRAIEAGERGVSGRLKSVTIRGSAGTATVERELAIRQAFGGLPSAMVIIQATPATGTPTAFTFIGGGRGHGVGMCQHGARGMAAASHGYDAILAHYFSGATMERTR